jgi:hypothetical protein
VASVLLECAESNENSLKNTTGDETQVYWL